MRKSHLLRGCAALSAVPLSLAALVVAASPAAACGGDAGIGGRPLRASIDSETYGVFVCVQPEGEPSSTYVVIAADAVERVTPTFQCANATSGAIGDPSDPATYIPYRIGFDPGTSPSVCAEVNGIAVTAQVMPYGSQPIVWIEQRAGASGGSCDGNTSTPFQAVYVQAPSGWQEVWVGVGSPFGGGSTSDCAGSDGEFDCRTGIPPMSFPGEDECPDGFAATQAVYGLPAYALAFADETGDTVVAVAGDAVTTVLTEVEPVLIEVGRILAPLVDEAWRVAGTVVGVVNDYAELGTTQGDCTVNVASAGDVAIMRSPTGQVPTSICLVVGSAVTRVTIG